MPDSDETPASTQRRQALKLYRRPPGPAWLIGAVAIPLLLAAIGYGAFDRPGAEVNGPTGALPTLTQPSRFSPPSGPPLSLAPVSVTRRGNDITLAGNFPDASAKTALLDAVLTGVGTDVNIVDNLGVDPNVKSLDFSKSQPVFKAAAVIPDFALSVSGDTVTLTGTAASADQDDAVEQAAEVAWPNLNITDDIEITGPLMPTATTTPTTAPTPGGPR